MSEDERWIYEEADKDAKREQSESKEIVHTMVYKWSDRGVAVDVVSDGGCEYSKVVPGCEVLRSCKLQPYKMLAPNGRIVTAYSKCMAIAYALNFERCPVREEALREGA